jgi:hypothetical protein
MKPANAAVDEVRRAEFGRMRGLVEGKQTLAAADALVESGRQQASRAE